MKVLLTTINSKFIHQNLAIRLLYELNKNYKSLDWKEFINKDNSDEIAKYCADYQIIAFSCYIWNITKTLEVAKKIKNINSDCKILLGGPEISYDWNEIIILNEIDFIITDEGEFPFSAFLDNFPDYEVVPNLIWKKSGKIIENDKCKALKLNILEGVNPYKNEPTDDLKNKICYIETSRGCPNKCEFCLAALDNKIRYLPEQNVKSNLKFLMENGRTIKFLDRTFNTNPQKAIEIFRFILENRKPANIFQFEIKADIIQSDIVEFIKSNVPKGIFRFEIGIQTLNSKSNAEVKRNQNFENIRNFINQISDNVEIHLDLIVGLPYDYWSDLKSTFEEVFKIFAPELQLGFLKFLKGTPIRINYEKHGYKFDKNPPYQIIESIYLSSEEIQKFEIIENVLEIYWNKKRATNTLKYIALKYSIFDFFLFFGKFFNEKSNQKKLNLSDYYDLIFEFSSNYYNDTIVNELIAVDYFLQHKVKPKIKFISEVEKSHKNKIIEDYKLNHHKFRFVILKLHFKLSLFFNENRIENKEEIVVIQFDGVRKSKIILTL